MDTLPADGTAIFRSLISISVLLTLLTVILSAYIRLAEVGIGCADWPQCYANLNPALEKKGITVLSQDGRDMAHYGARVAHRYIASVLGICVLVMVVLALRQGSARATSLLLPWSILGITVFLSLLGYYTPTRSNPLITMGNLLGGMSLLALLWWLMQREAAGGSLVLPGAAARYRSLAAVAVCLVLFQIILGGWSSANYASASCPGLLQCESGVLAEPAGVLNPLRIIEVDERGQVVRAPALGLLSMLHRMFALFTAAYLAWLVRKLKPEPLLAGTVLALSLFSVSQIALGVGMIWLQLPLPLATLHNALAAALLLASVNLLHRLTPAAGSQSPASPPLHPPG